MTHPELAKYAVAWTDYSRPVIISYHRTYMMAWLGAKIDQAMYHRTAWVVTL